ncbi:hypothetical protein B0H19DRAFT_1085566 [Mycena capillaripes]|nr:hypothetical protein B0H19DRAFT_1085566 [Mycena capillaripes]
MSSSTSTQSPINISTTITQLQPAMVSPQATIPTFADPQYEGTSPSLHLGRIGVFVFTPSRSDEESSDRCEPSQQPGAPSDPSLNEPAESLYATANVPYPQPFAGYQGQYMMLNMAHTPPTPFAYRPYASHRPPYTSPCPQAPSPRSNPPGLPPAFRLPVPTIPALHKQQVGDGNTLWYVPPQPYPLYPPSPVGQHPDANSSRPPSTPSSSGAPSLAPSGPDKPFVRRVYHPNPPAHRSEWVMWLGNVPATRRTTNSGASSRATTTTACSPSSPSRAPAARSSTTRAGAQRDAATERFNGVPLRADPRCPLLVCRARRRDDDLRAGVRGQRGMGMHSRWVKAQAEKAASASDSGSSHLGLSALSIDDDVPRGRRLVRSSGLKQLRLARIDRLEPPPPALPAADDLDLSAQTGVWATQKHNEGILDRAFRTSQDVFLIFRLSQ